MMALGSPSLVVPVLHLQRNLSLLFVLHPLIPVHFSHKIVFGEQLDEYLLSASLPAGRATASFAGRTS